MNAHTLRTTFLAMCLAATPAAAQTAADSAWSSGQHDRARGLYAQRVAADSSDTVALHRLALLLSWQREFAQATRLFDRLLVLTPGDTAVLRARARTLSWAGRYESAESAYRDLLRDDAADVEAARGLARITTWRGDLQGGEALWRQLAAANPNDVPAHIGLSQVLRWQGRSYEALQEARAAVRLAPDDNDARAQLLWAEAAIGPRVAPSFSAELDSDDNSVMTSALSVSGSISRRLSVTAYGSLQRAQDGEISPAHVQSRSASLGARYELHDGWSISGSGGVVDRSMRELVATYSAALASPAWRRTTAMLSYNHSLLAGTALLITRRVTNDETSLTLSHALSPNVRIAQSAALASFHGSSTNHRLLGRLAVDARITQRWHALPRITAFSSSNAINDGYFNPNAYALMELGLQWQRYQNSWVFNAEVAPGAQKIGSHGSLTGAFSGRGGVSYIVAPGREVGVQFAFSNLGIERLQASSAGYRYQAAVISVAWAL